MIETKLCNTKVKGFALELIVDFAAIENTLCELLNIRTMAEMKKIFFSKNS